MSSPNAFAKLAARRFPRRSFGLRTVPQLAGAALAQDRASGVSASDDFKLFALNFLGGLVFMTVYLA